MNKATQWLKNPSRTYPEGVLIYKEAFGIDASYAFFNSAHDPKPGALHFNLLIEKIKVAERRLANSAEQDQEVLPANRPEINVKPIDMKKNPRIVDNPLVEVTALPAELQEKFFRNKEIVRELAGQHAAMKAAKNDAARAKHLNSCKELEKEKDSNWKAIDSWWNKNKDQVKSQPPKSEQPDIEKRMETVRKSIARAKLELKDTTMDVKKRNARKSKIEAWEKEMKDLKKQKDAG